MAPVITAARLRARQLQDGLGMAHMATWRSLVAPRWLPLPARPVPGNGAARNIHIAVDGTSHSVQLGTGAHFIMAMAAAVGSLPQIHRERADMEILPARFDDSQAASARDLLMRSQEALVTSDAASDIQQAECSSRSVLWVDGSLFADLSHMAGAPGRVQWGSQVERAGHLLRTTAALLDRAESSGLWLIGIGKTQRAGFLFDALSSNPSSPAVPAEERPADGELLAAMGTGWSWPIVLDGSRIPFVSPAAQDALRSCPAIVSCYVRPHPADFPLRVDVPASMLGLEDRLFPQLTGEATRSWPTWLPDPTVMRPAVEMALASYGGVHAHNAPLYAVDRLVRLSRRELETRYLPICAKIAELPLDAFGVDRGRRRFVMS